MSLLPSQRQVAAIAVWITLALIAWGAVELPVALLEPVWSPLQISRYPRIDHHRFAAPIRVPKKLGISRVKPDARAGDVQIWEDGFPLGPNAADLDVIAGTGAGAFAYDGSPQDEQFGGVIYFSSSDQSNPRENGRSYVVTGLFEIAPIPGLAFAILWLAGMTVLVAGFRHRESITEAIAGSGALNPRAFLVSILVAGFSLYAVSGAHLRFGPKETGLVVLLSCSALGLLLRSWRRGRVFLTLPRFALRSWPFALLVWLAYSGIGTLLGPYGNPAVWKQTMIACLVGGLVVLGFRGQLAGPGRHPTLLVALVVVAACSYLLMERSGVDISTQLWSWPSHRWTEKFGCTWILGLAWLAWVGLPRSRKLDLLFVSLLGTTIWISTISSAKLALLASIAAWLAARRGSSEVVRRMGSVFALVVLFSPLLVGGLFRFAAPYLDQSVLWQYKLSGRVVMWEYARQLIGEHPWLGWGYGAAWSLPDQAEALAMHPVARAEMTPLDPDRVLGFPGGHPHSLPLLVWADGGLVGALLFAAFLAGVFRRLSQIVDTDRRAGITAGVVSLLVIFFLNYPSQRAPLVFLLLMFGACVGALFPSPSDAGLGRLAPGPR